MNTRVDLADENGSAGEFEEEMTHALHPLDVRHEIGDQALVLLLLQIHCDEGGSACSWILFCLSRHLFLGALLNLINHVTIDFLHFPISLGRKSI